MTGPAGLASWFRALFIAAAVLIGLAVSARSGRAQDALLPLVELEGNLVALGVGAYPDYIGSNDYSIGAVPLGHYRFWGQRDVTLLGNAVNVNVLDVAGWRFGPSAMVRFGRSDADDEAVSRVHDVDPSLDLGVFGGYTWAVAPDPRARVGVRAWALWDVTDGHGGWTAGVGAFGSYPVLKFLTLAGGVGATHGSDSYMRAYFGVTPADAQASGLAAYQPDAGVRDVRGWFAILLHLSPHWTVGGGVLYSRLTDEAKRSPIVSERGTSNQWIYGIGAMFVW